MLERTQTGDSLALEKLIDAQPNDTSRSCTTLRIRRMR